MKVSAYEKVLSDIAGLPIEEVTARDYDKPNLSKLRVQYSYMV